MAFTHSGIQGSIPERGNDIEFHMLPFWLGSFPFTSCWPEIPLRREVAEGILIYPTLLLPRSRGKLQLRSTSPTKHPVLDPCYLTDPHDMHVAIAAHHKAREFVKTPALQELLSGEVLDTQIRHDPDTDDYIEEYITRHCDTVHHHCGTARMGPDGDAAAVLDLKLRVRAVKDLRVADASVMPGIVAGNINAAVIMIGERVADFMCTE